MFWKNYNNMPYFSCVIYQDYTGVKGLAQGLFSGPTHYPADLGIELATFQSQGFTLCYILQLITYTWWVFYGLILVFLDEYIQT